MKMSRIGLLLSTIEYFGVDSEHRRCVSDNGGCFYSPERSKNSATTEGCAIGRLLTPDVQKAFDRSRSSAINTVATDPRLKILMPKWLQNMPVDFLLDVQDLHDNKDYWDKFGLSLIGKGRVQYIINKHKLRLPKYQTIYLG